MPDDGPALAAARPLAAALAALLVGRSARRVVLRTALTSLGASPRRSARPSATAMTWWPPNWPRSAATACIVGDSCWREANRANSDAEITGIGTELAIASSTVQRPSPESAV